jgi:RNA polymerase sigma-70 factor (ECF subfamily)
LIAGLRNQDRDAWSRLAQLYGPLVYSWCRRHRLDKEDAADVVQEVFRKVAGHIRDFDHGEGSSFRGWLWTITRNQIMDHFRGLKRHPRGVGGSSARQRIEEIPDQLEDLEPPAAAAGSLVRRALDMIRPDFSEPTWQAFWGVMMDDKPAAEVAAALGISVNAVYIAKSRVLRRLREVLGEDEAENAT